MKDGLHLKPERVDLFLHDLPEEIPIHFPIVMDEDMAHACNSLPRNHRVSFFYPSTELPGRFAHNLDLFQEEPASHFIPFILLPGRHIMGADQSDRFNDVMEPLAITPHTATASTSTVSRNLGRISFCSAITSTGQPSSRETFSLKSRRRKESLPGRRRTIKSTSLEGPSSPRATDPKSLTSVSWYLFAKARISLRCLATNSRFVMTDVVTLF